MLLKFNRHIQLRQQDETAVPAESSTTAVGNQTDSHPTSLEIHAEKGEGDYLAGLAFVA